LHSAVAPLPGATVAGAGAGCTTGGAATVGGELDPCAVAVATGSGVGVPVATSPGADVVDDAGAAGVTVVNGADVVGGGASAPTVMMIMDAASATPPAARLPNRAQPTLPRAKAITPTTSTKNPSIIAAPLKPELMAPITPARVTPPQPNTSAVPNLRPLAGAACLEACLFFSIGRAIVVSTGTPVLKCSLHNWPSQHLC